MSGSTIGSCSICNRSNSQAAIDGDRDSFADLRLGAGGMALRATGPEFAGGNFAGALMRIPADYSPQTTWVFTTYLGGLPMETRSVANAQGGDPANPIDGDDFYGFVTTLPFDGVEISVEGGSPTLNTDELPVIRIYEFCGTL